MQYRTKDGDVLDNICWQYYGYTTGSTEIVLEANRKLEQYDAVFAAGIIIELPEIETPETEDTIKLWS
nr:hypothetical protein 1 [Kangiellaceae bacterium]